MMKDIAIVLLAAFLAGCSTEKPDAKGHLVTRIGFLPAEVMQHPIVPEPLFGEKQNQFYFDLGDKPGSTRQIIVVYPVGTDIPTELERKVELTGSVSAFAVGGNPGTKGEYENEVLTLQGWKYLK